MDREHSDWRDPVRWRMVGATHPASWRIPVVAVLLLAACGVLWLEKVDFDDPRVVSMMEAIEKVDRESLGFRPIDRGATLRLERGRKKYDAALHVGAEGGLIGTVILFRKEDGGYRWIREDEYHSGPNTYTTVDGTSWERISLIYQLERVDGAPVGELVVRYSGEDSRLTPRGSTWGRDDLTLEEVRPILNEWSDLRATSPRPTWPW